MVPHHTHSARGFPSAAREFGVKDLLTTADQAPGEDEAAVGAAITAVATTRSTTNTNIHPLALPPPTGSTPRVMQEKDLLTDEVIMDDTDMNMDTGTKAHEALDITAEEDEEDGVDVEASADGDAAAFEALLPSADPIRVST